MQKGKKKAPNDLPADVQMAPPAPNVSLWCVLEGDPPPFQISVPSGTDVDGLKDAIKDENTPELDHLPSRRLRLFQVCTVRLAYSTQLMHSWKPNTNVPLSPRNTLLSRLPAVESWKELEEHHEVSSVLEPLTPNHLHIIVRRPSEGECKCLVITVILTMSFHDLPLLSSFTGHLISIYKCISLLKFFSFQLSESVPVHHQQKLVIMQPRGGRLVSTTVTRRLRFADMVIVYLISVL